MTKENNACVCICISLNVSCHLYRYCYIIRLFTFCLPYTLYYICFSICVDVNQDIVDSDIKKVNVPKFTQISSEGSVTCNKFEKGLAKKFF